MGAIFLEIWIGFSKFRKYSQLQALIVLLQIQSPFWVIPCEKAYLRAWVYGRAHFEAILDLVQQNTIDDEAFPSAVFADNRNDAETLPFEGFQEGDRLGGDREPPVLVNLDKLDPEPDFNRKI